VVDFSPESRLKKNFRDKRKTTPMEVLYASIPADFLNHEMFEQLIELERDDPGFLKDIIATFISQATSSFQSLEIQYSQRNLEEISRIGHLLKGASAALGLSTLSLTCERIQYLGKSKNSPLDTIQKEIHLANLQFQMAKELLARTLLSL
jgi:HPt (histidine-containing phosphotransfer) domain-containing protein